MQRHTDESFYHSKAWKLARRNVWIKQSCLCAKCGKAVYVAGLSEYIPKEKRLKGIVHHKIHLNFDNVYDESISLNEDNLVGWCINCHNSEHFSGKVTKDGVIFDSKGNLVPC